LQRSTSGWVTWDEVASTHCGPVDLLMAYADLPEWRKLFAVRRDGVFVKLTVDGVKFARDSVARNRTRLPFKSSVGITFVWIRHGTFLMGSPPDEKNRERIESQHKIRLSNGWFMGIHPVTQAQWRTVMGTNPSRFPGDTLPVEQVTWHECHEFCKRLTVMDGKPYRLPTEAEWEFACRAGTTTPFHFGETISTDQANFDGKYVHGDGQEGTCRQKTTPVGVFPPNAWGLYDFHGNVWEWCKDWYGPYPIEDSEDYDGPLHGAERVIRGGAWNQIPKRCRSAYRERADPMKRRKDVGFRICFSEG
jgi:formylglycine-generating enzyme